VRLEDWHAKANTFMASGMDLQQSVAETTRASRAAEFRDIMASALARRPEFSPFDAGVAKLLSLVIDRDAIHTDLRVHGHRLGTMRAGSHVGELVQGIEILPGLPQHLQDVRLEIPDAVRCLIDLPCDVLASTAIVRVTGGTGKITTTPAGLKKGADAAEALLVFLDLERAVDVHIMLETNIRHGRGLGSSSADVRAVLGGLASALRVTLDHDVIDLLTVIAEGATNPAARYPTLFCHRIGLTIARLSRWPKLTVLAFDDSAARNVDTDIYKPAQYDADQVRRFGLLTRAALGAIERGNARGLAVVASISADINDEFLSREHGSALVNLRRICRKTDALGYAVSHSGTAGALLYSPSSGDLARCLQHAADELTGARCSILTAPFQL
jgi:uncharacterized protein involved in propanediol utilization